jgi:hypothetical protein
MNAQEERLRTLHMFCKVHVEVNTLPEPKTAALTLHAQPLSFDPQP